MTNSQELQEIKDQIRELLEQARRTIQCATREHRIIYQRAKSYWLGHIACALDDDNDYMQMKGQSTFQSTINEIKALEKDNELNQEVEEELTEEFDPE